MRVAVFAVMFVAVCGRPALAELMDLTHLSTNTWTYESNWWDKEKSHDGDWEGTGWYGSYNSHTSGDVDLRLTLEYASPWRVETVTSSMEATASTNPDNDDHGKNVWLEVEYMQQGGAFQRLDYEEKRGGGPGQINVAWTNPPKTLADLALDNVVALRWTAHADSFTTGTNGADASAFIYEVQVMGVPEPSAVLLLLSGAGAVACVGWRRKK